MKNDLGFLCLDLKQTVEHNTLMSIIRSIIDNNPFNQVCVFNHSSSRTGYENVPVLPISHCKFFEGDLFLFDILSLSMSKNFPGIKTKYLYYPSIPWTPPNNYYMMWKDLLKDSDLKIITTDTVLQQIYKTCWDIDTKNIENFSYEGITNAIQ